MKRALAIVSFPLVILGSATGVHLLSPRVGKDLAFGLVALLASAFMLLLERVIPYREAWRPSRRELALDATWVGVAVAISTIVQLVVLRLVPTTHPAADLPLV
jgi:hypothetical protein